MTKPIPLDLPRRGVKTENLPTASDVTVGRYAYTPGAAHPAHGVRGVLHGGGAEVENRVTESLLTEFLTLLDAAQAELNLRWGGQRTSDRPADRV